MDKEYTSQVELSREKFEEPEKIIGRMIKSNQIWRDANLLPETAPKYIGKLIDTSDPEGRHYKTGVVYTFNDGATVNKLISYYDALPLTKVPGTINCYSSPDLKNIILEDSGETYVPKIYFDGHKLAYGVGQPVFDVAAGTIYFTDAKFITDHVNEAVSISFYRYIGRMGTSVGNGLDNLDLPFRDSVKHFKNAENDDQTATIKVRGDVKNTNYILPSDNGKWYDKSNSGYEEDSSDTAVVLLQETLEDTLWCQHTKISGGNWKDTTGSVEVSR
jgi:hypothetical protein